MLPHADVSVNLQDFCKAWILFDEVLLYRHAASVMIIRHKLWGQSP